MIIRASGKEIGSLGFQGMWTLVEIVLESKEITKGKGSQDDDLPKITSIFKCIDERWQVTWMQRSSGQSNMILSND